MNAKPSCVNAKNLPVTPTLTKHFRYYNKKDYVNRTNFIRIFSTIIGIGLFLLFLVHP